jgi:hypothetical protein
LALMLSAVTASGAQASVGFCENVKLGPGASCEYPEYTLVTSVLGEVTIGNAEICVAIKEAGGVTVGKECGFDFAQSQSGVGASKGKAWIKNNSKTATVTVFGIFTQ